MTHGIIDQMIGLYMYMNIDYLSQKKRPTVDADFVRSTAEKHYRGMQYLLANYADSTNEMERRRIVENAESELQKVIACGSQNLFAEKIKQSEEKTGFDNKTRKENVIRNIMMTTDEYAIETIGDAFDRVQNLEAAQNRTERDITRMVLKKLQETKKKALRKKTDRKEISHEAMAKFIME